MKRIAIMCIRNIFFIPYWFIRICQLSHADKYDEETRYGFLHKIVPRANKTGRIKIECYGLEDLPKENGYIMFPNHQGLFDALSFLETHERPFSVVMKKETQKIFILRKFLSLLQGQVIDREDVRQSMRVIMNMTKEVKEGRNYVIFAEGTRSKHGNEVQEFKGGTFKSAMNAHCPIVPVALINAFKVFDTNSIKKVTVQIHYLPPLYYEDYKGLKSTEIAEIVSDKIKEAIRLHENQ